MGCIARELLCSRTTVSLMVRRFESGLPPHMPRRRGVSYASRKLRYQELAVLRAMVDSTEELYLDEIVERLSAVGAAEVSESTVFKR